MLGRATAAARGRNEPGIEDQSSKAVRNGVACGTRWAVRDLPCRYGQIPSHSSRARHLGRAGLDVVGRQPVRLGSPGRLRLRPAHRPRRPALDHPRAAHRARRGRAVRRPRRAARAERRRAHPAAVRRVHLRRPGADRRHPRRRLRVRLRHEAAASASCAAGMASPRRSAARSPPSTRCRPASSPMPACRRSQPVEILRAAVTIMDRAAATGLVPAALLRPLGARGRGLGALAVPPDRHQRRARAPTRSSAHDDEVTGVLGWHGLSVGDPARDLHWLLGVRGDGVADTAHRRLHRARAARATASSRQRAMLYARARDRPLAAARHPGAQHRDRR